MAHFINMFSYLTSEMGVTVEICRDQAIGF